MLRVFLATSGVFALAPRKALAVLVLVGVGCGSEAAVPLCDGSQGLTLRVFVSGNPGQEVLGSAVRVENGYPSFAVDGQCRYFISGGWGVNAQGRDEGWRQGMVDAALRGKLERMAGMEDLRTLNDCGSSELIDSGPLVIANTRSSLRCTGSQGRRVTAVFDAVDPALWAQGAPLDQALHITAWEGLGGRALEARYAWPNELALQDYFEADTNVFFEEPVGNSRLVPATDAGPLRSLRERYLSDTRGMPSLDGIPVRDGDLSAAVFVRDALPYEDERGLWPLPGE